MTNERVYLYDTTLRDGAQTQGVDFSVSDKTKIADRLDSLGIDYIEGGWPGANPTDDAFFATKPQLEHSRLTAFGMTRRPGRSAENDPGLNALFNCGATAICMVGKAWDFQVKVALGIAATENLDMISDSIGLASKRVSETLFDAEHFFDGYKADSDYAMACLDAAYQNGARWIVLCDTNGGTLPDEVSYIVEAVRDHIPGEHIGVHFHDDTGNAVANSLAAVRAGARHVQGTMNGLGERCGNANLISLMPTLALKMGYQCGPGKDGLKDLTPTAHLIDELLNRAPNRGAPYVGAAAFAHKGGLHVAGVRKNPRCYEHIEPDIVGNVRQIVVSDQSGRANILTRLENLGIDVPKDHPKIPRLLEAVKDLEFEGSSFDGADASFELLARRILGTVPEFLKVNSYRVLIERRYNALGKLITVSEATVKVEIRGEERISVAEGNGPVDALTHALRKDLGEYARFLDDWRLVDYKVRIVTPNDGTRAVTRVMIESADGRADPWITVGLSPNIVDASFNALLDSITYKLLRDGAPSA